MLKIKSLDVCLRCTDNQDRTVTFVIPGLLNVIFRWHLVSVGAHNLYVVVRILFDLDCIFGKTYTLLYCSNHLSLFDWRTIPSSYVSHNIEFPPILKNGDNQALRKPQRHVNTSGLRLMRSSRQLIRTNDSEQTKIIHLQHPSSE